MIAGPAIEIDETLDLFRSAKREQIVRVGETQLLYGEEKLLQRQLLYELRGRRVREDRICAISPTGTRQRGAKTAERNDLFAVLRHGRRKLRTPRGCVKSSMLPRGRSVLWCEA